MNSYYYYLHGPLARMELGDLWGKVQGADYAYTLQGWLKGVNSTQVTSAQDMGGDGRTGTTIPQDAYGYALYYHGNGSTKFDYRPLDGSQQPFETVIPQNTVFRALYNGNIAASSINLPRLSTKWFYNYYRYDQLNRLTLSQLYNATGPGTAYTATTDHKETFTYDANGNIKTLVRNGNTLSGNNKMDSLIYHYNTDSQGRLTNNKLTYLSDLASDANWQSDLKDQATGNYKYDAIGNVTGDVKAGLRTVSWTVYGKIRTIAKTSGDFSYYYNSSGQRTKKTAAGLNTYYVRDAQGNTLAIYDNKNGNTNWREQHLYGSSRLGMWQPNLRLGTDSSRIAWDTLGNKQYELTNHLGNVMATITDRRLQQHDAADTSLLYLTPDVATAQEYYAFGSLLQGKRFTADTSYRYGFNGKENDNDIKGTGNEQDYGMRIYDPRLGRFLSVDPLSRKYPMLTSYQFASNDPIESIDEDGLERVDFRLRQNKDGTTQLTKLSTGSTTAITHPLVIGGISMPWPTKTVPVPYQARVEYNGKHYLFGDGGDKSKAEDDNFNMDVTVNYAKFLAPFVKDPDKFAKKLETEEQGYERTNNRNLKLAAAEVVVDAMTTAVIASVHNGNTTAIENNVVEPENIEVKMKKGWTPEQQKAVMDKIIKINSANPTVTTDITRGSNTRGRFQKAGGNVTASQDVDHILDLQLGGADEFWNMQGLDKNVNRSLGSQIQKQIKKLPVGTKVNITVKGP